MTMPRDMALRVKHARVVGVSKELDLDESLRLRQTG